MIGTRFDTMGGISSVVSVYRATGMLSRGGITYIATHCDGGAAAKLRIFMAAWLRFMAGLVTGRWRLVHAHVSSRMSFWRKSLFLLPALAFRCPVVLHLHGSEFKIFFEQECTPWQRSLVRLIYRRSACVIVLSPSWRDWVQTHCPNPHVHVVVNPVLYREQTDKTGESYASQTILFLGRLGQRKGAYDLVRALSRLKADGLTPTLLMGGDGEVEQVRQLAEQLGVCAQVKMLGWVRGEVKQRLLDEATLYVLPSYNEGLPMGVLEAMEAGLPIVSTPIGGIPDAVTDGGEGFLVAPGDIEALTRALAALLTTPELAERQGQAARTKVQRLFSHLAVEPQILGIHANVTRGAP